MGVGFFGTGGMLNGPHLQMAEIVLERGYLQMLEAVRLMSKTRNQFSVIAPQYGAAQPLGRASAAPAAERSS
jgi:hypothetical protein